MGAAVIRLAGFAMALVLATGVCVPATALPVGAVLASPAQPEDPRAEAYASAVTAIESGEPGGLTALRSVAVSGYTPAQFYLASLYEKGSGGAKRDPHEAMVWTERAAQGGDRKAMHNLALHYFYGEGVAKDQALAAVWFERAARLGLVDAQYNMGRIYEVGNGVGRDPKVAYTWYLIAAAAGDAEAVKSAARVKDLLSSADRVVAEAAASEADPRSGLILAGAAAQALSAKALAKLGYYKGPADGSSSVELTSAISDFQRAQALPVTGRLDEQTLALVLRAAR